MARRLMIVAMAVLATIGCRDRESVTGSYGSGVVSGEVVMTDGASPAGITVTLGGLTTMTDDDGRFAFVNAPQNLPLHFRRAADDIDASLKVGAVSGPITVELSSNGAHGRGRASNGPRPIVFEGTIKSVSATQLVVTDEKGQDVTFVLTADTVVKKEDEKVAASTLAAGMRVHVMASVNGDVKTAILVIVQQDDDEGENESPRVEANGKVTEVGVSQLTVDTGRAVVKVTVDADTIIKKQGVRIGLDGINVGDEVNCHARKRGDVILAEQIEVRGNSGRK